MKHLSHALAFALTLTTVSGAHAQSAPDNTRQNKLDTSNRSASADMQGNDQTDLMLTREIRSRVMADKSLSTYAHNVKIVAVKGDVTLSGAVHSQEEKDAVGAKALAVVKGGSVVNNLKVAP